MKMPDNGLRQFLPFRSIKLIFVLVCLALFPWTSTSSSGSETKSAFDNSVETLTVSFIDVGQGDSILVEFPDDETMLVDAGPRRAGDDVAEYLHERNVDTINFLVATHPHEDHIGGMLYIMNEYPVEEIWDSGYNQGSDVQNNFIQYIYSHDIPIEIVSAGAPQEIGGATVQILAPENVPATPRYDANNYSIVIRIEYGDISFLLTGDMGAEERESVDSWPDSTVLKIAHHGALIGTDAAFVRDVAPRIAVISYGYGNQYGHPSQGTRDVLSAYGCAVKSTAANGTIMMTTDGSRLEIRTGL
jgi:competence protein ComEC